MNKILVLSLLLVLSVIGCKKDRPVLEAPGSKLEGINATWEMVDVVQVDIASLAQKTLNVSQAFIGTKAMKIKFNSADFTYEVTPGSGPNYFGTSGTWAFDDNEFPTLITLTEQGGDKKALPLVRTVRPVDTYLNFSYSRQCVNADAPYVAYEFKFVRTNQ